MKTPGVLFRKIMPVAIPHPLPLRTRHQRHITSKDSTKGRLKMPLFHHAKTRARGFTSPMWGRVPVSSSRHATAPLRQPSASQGTGVSLHSTLPASPGTSPTANPFFATVNSPLSPRGPAMATSLRA